MSERDEQLARYQFQMGPARGRLAAALDILTDALALAGQHGMYCRNPSGLAEPARDLRIVVRHIEDSKAFIIEAMEELKNREPGSGQ